MQPGTALYLSLAFTILYGALFVVHFQRHDGRGRIYLLICFAALGTFFATRVIGYAGLHELHWLDAAQVNELYRWTTYLVAVPGVWIAGIELYR